MTKQSWEERFDERFASKKIFKVIAPSMNCCSKCADVDFEKTYPAHTATQFCSDSKCNCHTPCENTCGFVEPYGFVPEAECPIHD